MFIDRQTLKYTQKQMASTKVIQEKYVQNMTDFVGLLPDTRIKFVFFEASKLDQPIVATSFGRYGDWFIVPGKDKNYCYSYKQSQIQYMVTELQVRARTGPIALYDVKLNYMTHKTKADEVANLGNHIDFAILKSKKDVFFSVHWAIYNDANGDLSLFTRDSHSTCKFLSDEKLIASNKFVPDTACVDITNTQIGMLPRQERYYSHT